MQITIKSGENETTPKILDKKYLTPGKASPRAFGTVLMFGVASIENRGYWTNFYLDEGHKRFKGPMFIETRYLSKALKAVEANKNCECGKLILCSCHEKCEVCEPCEGGAKTAKVVESIGGRVLNGIQSFIFGYDDKREHEDRGEN